MHNKPAISSVPIHDILQNRWSPRSFDADKSIDPQTLTALLEAARWAPSCFNDQPWRFLVCNKTTHLSAWEKLLSTLGEKNQLWARNAPVLILSMAMHEFGHNGKPNRWSMYDAGAASVSLCLQATAMGLATHQMGGFDAAQCKQSFDLPDACNPMSVIAVGHRAAAELLPDDLRETELKARSRKPLNECFYFGSFNA
ncbi:nitroreductase family protein [Methylomonas rivi]|uniref:Nitroreductase family protein n=1 Tax=Methylomonas rivi TaxID=2952226 RepID=A0ABT1U4F2_9GAMM|nr:nitroreductase family protein [Methylomonas sp. WSC-6]MCQ8128728.1 nitroreductase family protein [Methylomonas sp. WSC-6]